MSGACDQSKDVGLALRLLVVPGPVIFVLVALLLLWAYPINEARRVYNIDRLEKIRYNIEHLEKNGYNTGRLEKSRYNIERLEKIRENRVIFAQAIV